ncbi:DUF998 domain-containing protein [Pseudomonas typographi]|uniref:DUF998 domain-containing protein n=1 Tax=Pseudomonas typographi TaxID=2715964 RepID=A0ABR7Z174_9PSED|nr:DUF998 domain-containing protein [Pseudomonas typographi]MBD1554593.1 DUF998 domain-containing protein [Pseudomonas typographi]MBD1589710.1 DUF998 domain-containing protein [Pseudomonas typographi]MBD1599187.1 DUF998 domain-containing protein [Pseudomonas typographi]
MHIDGRTPAYLLGLLIPFWLLGGLLVTASFYPGYSQMAQAMSVLGAVGAPTEGLAPLINNYPLGLMFLVFAGAVYFTPGLPRLARITAVLIAIHGVASLFAGYFACDALCKPEVPSLSQQVHTVASAVMLLSLLLASGLWCYLAFRLPFRAFGFFSIIMTFATAASLPWMAAAAQMDTHFGLYQRFSYGTQVLWLAGLALTLIKRPLR